VSEKDNPFGDFNRGDRTVIRPNPAGRLPQQPASPQAMPPPPQQQPQYPPPPPSAPQRADGDDWIASQRQTTDAEAHKQRAEDLRFDELAAEHPNPVMRAAGPLLLLLGRLRVAAMRASFASLMDQVAAAIDFFEKDIRSAGIPSDQVDTAKYILCATADDIVQNIPTEDRHVWTRYSMLSRFFGERVGGVRFFDFLNRLKSEPAVNFNVLELQHACLALGFQGVHRTSPDGQARLQQIQRDLYETLRRVRPRQMLDLSPRWQGQQLAARQSRIRVPVWSVAAAVAALLVGAFILLSGWLSSQSEAVAAETVALHPPTKVALQRPLPAPPPKIEPTPTQLTQLQRIRAALLPNPKGCELTADAVGGYIAIRVCSLILFDSGKANLLPEFTPVAERIAGVLDKEPGPIKVTGHTDNQALSRSNPYRTNQNLSLERAKAVSALLATKLSDAKRLAVEGRGPDDPVADNASADGRAKNRRVEILITRSD